MSYWARREAERLDYTGAYVVCTTDKDQDFLSGLPLLLTLFSASCRFLQHRKCLGIIFVLKKIKVKVFDLHINIDDPTIEPKRLSPCPPETELCRRVSSECIFQEGSHTCSPTLLQSYLLFSCAQLYLVIYGPSLIQLLLLALWAKTSIMFKCIFSACIILTFKGQQPFLLRPAGTAVCGFSVHCCGPES